MRKAIRLVTALIISASLLLSAGPAFAGGKHYVDTAHDRAMVKIIRAEAKKARLGTADTNALITLGGRESDWSPKAVSKARRVKNRCYGMFQLSYSMAHGNPWSDPSWNTRRAIKYIKGRYGTPRKALAHSYRHNWY